MLTWLSIIVMHMQWAQNCKGKNLPAKEPSLFCAATNYYVTNRILSLSLFISLSYSLLTLSWLAFNHYALFLKSYSTQSPLQLSGITQIHLIKNDEKWNIFRPTSSECATGFRREKYFSSDLIHLAYANERLNLFRGRGLWEIGESTILFTLIGNVRRAVNQFRASFGFF